MTFTEAAASLMTHLRLAQYSPATLKHIGGQLKPFGAWLAQHKITDLRRIGIVQVDAYQCHVRGEAIGRACQAYRLRAMKRLFAHLAEGGQLVFNPAEHVRHADRGTHLPRPVLSVGEMHKLLAAPDTATAYGMRDRALFEVLYATGVRVGELEQVTIDHIDFAQQTLQVHHAKGGRARVVPLGRSAAHWLKQYLTHARPKLSKRASGERALFLVRGGKPLRQTEIRALLQRYRKAVGIGKAVTPHLLRHACATHLLAAGADIRMIAQLLGHVNLNSTTIYTRVQPLDVKATHARTHPTEAGDATR